MAGQLTPAVNEQDHVQGTNSAKVEIVEFGDYQCPYCGDAHPILQEIEDTFGEQISFVFRNFPLQNTHQYAIPAAFAAEAAGLQNKFWEMHNALFNNQHRLSTEIFDELAKSIGLDVQQFNADRESDTVRNKVEADFESGMRSGVNGTPSFYVNGEKFDGGVEDLYAMLKESTS